MDLIVEIDFGAHLYGTATASSDTDVKAVYLPTARDILLQRVRGSLVPPRTKPAGEKNDAADIDFEAYSLQRYLDLLAEGQPVAIEMLFAPDHAMRRPPTPLWQEICDAAPRLVSRRAAVFVRYCRRQADMFGIKGRRVAVAGQMLDALRQAEAAYGASAALARAEAQILPLLAAPHSCLIDLAMPGGRVVRHLEVCGKRMPFTASLKSARETLQRLVDGYGARARQAELHDGVDWKALSHAVRVGREAVDLLRHGRLVFPLPYATHLLAIKRGAHPYDDVAQEIEHWLGEAEKAAAESSLPDAPDPALIEALVMRAYRRQIEKNP